MTEVYSMIALKRRRHNYSRRLLNWHGLGMTLEHYRLIISGVLGRPQEETGFRIDRQVGDISPETHTSDEESSSPSSHWAKFCIIAEHFS